MTESETSVRRGGLPAHTARRIMADFTSRGAKAGDGLADEATLLEWYGVSRGTLRESLRLLSFMGAVTVKAGPNGGPKLSVPDPGVVGSALGMVTQFQGATLRSVFEARLVIEPAVVALSAQSRSDEDLERLYEASAAIAAQVGKRGPAYAQRAADFSLLAARASRNPLLAALVPAVVAMNATVKWRYPTGAREEFARNIAVVVDAIRDRNGEAAGSVMRYMLTWLIDALSSQQPDALESPVLWHEVDLVLTEIREK